MQQDTADLIAEGEHVKVTITGRVSAITVGKEDPSELLLTVEYHVASAATGHVDQHFIIIDPSCDVITVDRLAPPEWPPRRGDVWVDRYGERYFAFACDEVLVNEYAKPAWPEDIRVKQGPMTLASRKAKS